MEQRSMERLRAHFEIERELAARLMAAPRAERGRLYMELYDELFARVPDHPQLTRKAANVDGARHLRSYWRVLERVLRPGQTFLELGIGDGRTCNWAADRVAKVYGVDVSSTVTAGADARSSFELIISDGLSVPVPSASVDVVASNQLMEHLHPDDVVGQLAEVYRVLKPGGVYVCFTPHRFSGPHDISRYFTEEACGFHLREYTLGELLDIFLDAGFSSTQAMVGARGIVVPLPTAPLLLAEKAVALLPQAQRRVLFAKTPLRVLSELRVISRK